jgi:hypothetical protein
MTDNYVHQTDQLRDVEDRRKNGQAEQRVRGYFTTDIFIEQTHGIARILAPQD